MTYATITRGRSLLHDLHHPWERDKLKGKRVHYRTRWDATERAGTIGRIGAGFIWIGCGCFAHRDITSMVEVENG
jgi:hypothetical protein